MVKIGRFKKFLFKHFPKIFKVSEELEETEFKMSQDESKSVHIDSPYIDWVVYAESSTISVTVKHTYSRKGECLFFDTEEVKLPYMYAHAEPQFIRPDGSTSISVSDLSGMPVFKFKNKMYDVSKIFYPDYASMQTLKGRLIEKSKDKFSILKEYTEWVEHMKRVSMDIMINAGS